MIREVVHEAAAVYRVRTRVRRARSEDASSADNPARVNARNLAEFAVHGAKYAFPAKRLPVALGLPPGMRGICRSGRNVGYESA